MVQLYCFYDSFFFSIQVSSWSAWGSCSAPPGRCSTNSGTRKRTRRVTLSNSCGGSSCPTLTHTSQCTPVPIPCKVILIIFSCFFTFATCWVMSKNALAGIQWIFTTFWILPAPWRYFAIFAKIVTLKGATFGIQFDSPFSPCLHFWTKVYSHL